MLKILASHLMNHIVRAAEGGRHHVVRGDLRPPLVKWSASIFSIGHFLFWGRWPLLGFPALASAKLWALAPIVVLKASLYLGLWPLLYLSLIHI